MIEEGINGLGNGVINTNSEEFLLLDKLINEKSLNQSKKKIISNKVFSIKLQMLRYLSSNPRIIKEVGFYIKELINCLEIKHKIFAEYIGLKESNLSALFNGTRKINIDLALKFDRIFKIEATIWLNIQNKNEIIRTQESSNFQYKNLSIDDLLKK